MNVLFIPTNKVGRHIYRICGNRTDWFKSDGQPATIAEANAIAQGWIEGDARVTSVRVGLIETSRDTQRAIEKAFCKWAATAPLESYGARSPYSSFDVSRGGEEGV